MPNPRYLTSDGEPTVELIDKLCTARQVYFSNLEWFCQKHGLSQEEFKAIRGIFLIGSHANDSGWQDETSDLDFKLVNSEALPEHLFTYKREVLDKLLHQGEKKRWIDLFFAREDYQVTDPKWNLTTYWNKLGKQASS